MTFPNHVFALMACVVLLSCQPAHGTSRGLSTGSQIHQAQQHHISPYQDDVGTDAANSYEVSTMSIADQAFDAEGDGGAVIEEDLPASVLDQLSQLLGSLLGGRHGRHHQHHKHKTPSPPPIGSPSYTPPGGYPYTPSAFPPFKAGGDYLYPGWPSGSIPPSGGDAPPSGFGPPSGSKAYTYPGWPGFSPPPSGDSPPGPAPKELPFHTGSTISLRSPALNKYCTLNDTTQLLQCDQEKASTAGGAGFLIIGETYVTNKILEGESLMMKVQPQNTVCGVNTAKEGNLVECGGRDAEANTHFTMRFAPGPQPEGKALLQLLPVAEPPSPYSSVSEPHAHVPDGENNGRQEARGRGAGIVGEQDTRSSERDSSSRVRDSSSKENKPIRESSTKEIGISRDEGGKGRQEDGGVDDGQGMKARVIYIGSRKEGQRERHLSEQGLPKVSAAFKAHAHEDGADEVESDSEGEGEKSDSSDEEDDPEDEDEDEEVDLEVIDDYGFFEEIEDYGQELESSKQQMDEAMMELLQQPMGSYLEEFEDDDYEEENGWLEKNKAKKEVLCVPEKGNTHALKCQKHDTADPVTFLEVEVTSPY